MDGKLVLSDSDISINTVLTLPNVSEITQEIIITKEHVMDEGGCEGMD